VFQKGKRRDGERKTFEVMTSTLPLWTLGSVATMLTVTLYILVMLITEHLLWLWDEERQKRDSLVPVCSLS